jgi:hypothetical protein
MLVRYGLLVRLLVRLRWLLGWHIRIGAKQIAWNVTMRQILRLGMTDEAALGPSSRSARSAPLAPWGDSAAHWGYDSLFVGIFALGVNLLLVSRPIDRPPPTVPLLMIPKHR